MSSTSCKEWDFFSFISYLQPRSIGFSVKRKNIIRLDRLKLERFFCDWGSEIGYKETMLCGYNLSKL